MHIVVNPEFDSICHIFYFSIVIVLGTKGVAKAMKEISCGAQKWEGEKWFAELSDKRKQLSNFISINSVKKESP